MPSGNPFVFERPLERTEDLLDREPQLAQLADTITAGRDVLIVGARGHGKTSLMNGALALVGSEGHGLAVRVDCSGVLTDDDLVRRVERAYTRAWIGEVLQDEFLERLESLSFHLAADASLSAPDARLRGLLELAGELAIERGSRVVLGFDEFQDAFALPGSVVTVDRTRQRQPGRVAYVFAGPGLASGDATAWSKRAPTLQVGPVDPTLFAGEIARRFTSTGRDSGEAAKVIAITGAGHPQRTNLLAAQLWELTGEGRRATIATAREAVDQALVRCSSELELRWQSLHTNERRVAVAIANWLAPQGTRAQRATGLAGFGAAQRAVQGITSSGVAEAREDRLVLTDPLFAEWLRRRHPQAPAEPGWQALRRRELERGISRRITR